MPSSPQRRRPPLPSAPPRSREPAAVADAPTPARWARTVDAPFGRLRVVATRDAVVELDLPERLGAPVPDGDGPLLAEAIAQLTAYFAGALRTFDLPLAPVGTPFQQLAWRALCEIPYGETRSYGDQARAIGRPAASRAVGAANGKNPIAIIVPCHRVIGADGALTGYGGGLARKQKLLDLERAHAA